ncbi:MAG: riboflavin synthase [Firmicutes bacterium]|nr:riboflavin synthase [Bacillota bacterium]
MFTGIVEGVGRLAAAWERTGGRALEIAADGVWLEGVAVGDSVSVAGACLTVVERSADAFRVEVVPETLSRTRLGSASPGTGLNLERALRLGDRLGGHIVLGHVDALAEVVARRPEGEGVRLVVRAPARLAPYLPDKAFVALDGVSLTVASGADADGRFAVALVPETLRRTTLGEASPGQALHLEVDPIARYLESLLAARRPGGAYAAPGGGEE